MDEKPNRQRAVLVAGLVIAAVSGLPGISLINCCCCAGIILGGVYAAHLYRQEFHPDAEFETSDALIVGLLAGLVGAVGATIISTLFTFAIGPMEEKFVSDLYGKILDRLAEAGTLPADTVDELRTQMEDSLGRALTFGGIISTFFLNIIIYPVFAMLGGLIGHAIFRKKVPPDPAPQ